jgi:trans-2,3-dihydro-3-hydroxyanthranilate isomerase
MFAPALGIPVDPATGSATGPLGAYMLEYGLLARRDGQHFTNEQGTAMGRRSLIYGIVHLDGSTLRSIEVGGSAVPLVEARMRLP